MSHQALWDYTLTPREKDVWKSIQFLLKKEKITVFTADDFYRWELNRFISGNAVGNFFRKLQNDGSIEQVGYKHSTRKSNNGREQKLWREKKNVCACAP